MNILLVGAGMAGLTAAAFLAKEQRSDWRIDLLEASDTAGGLVKGRWKDGFYLDQGVRALEDAGIIRPMLRALGVTLPFLPNPISLVVGNDVIPYHGIDDLAAFLDVVIRHFPEERAAVQAIGDEIRKVSSLIGFVYSIDNPLFEEPKHDLATLKKMLPWLWKYPRVQREMKRLQVPVRDYLMRYTQNTAIIDLFIQHFFEDTPAFFALSYYGVYGDYMYPQGGTQALTDILVAYLKRNGVRLHTAHRVLSVDREVRCCRVEHGGETSEWFYDALIWAGDPRPLEAAHILPPRVTRQTTESVLTYSVGLTRPPEAFAAVVPSHAFWTPRIEGLSALGAFPGFADTPEAAAEWLTAYMARTTYEISIPALRDPTLAPPEATGIILSTILHADVERAFAEAQCRDTFTSIVQRGFATVLEQLAPRYAADLVFTSLNTPCDLERYTLNTNGAISGWKVTYGESAAPSLRHAVETAAPDVFQAGQWVIQPAGVPVSLLTGKLAADAVKRQFS